MTAPEPSRAPREIRIPASDGHTLAATVHGRADAQRVVVLNSALGVKRGYYDPFARFLADRGFAVVTFDYRGIGGSRPETLRGYPARMRDWAEKDIAGAIAWADKEFRPERLLVVGHSCGGWLLGLLPDPGRIDGAVLVASQSGHWRHWRGLDRWRLWALWHGIIPALAPAFGYFPSGAVGMGGEDIPRGVALEWARWGRHPSFVMGDFSLSVRYDALRCPILSYSLADDNYAPAAAVDWLAGQFTAATVQRRHVQPAEIGADAIGHFGFFRTRFEDTLWRDAAAFLETA